MRPLGTLGGRTSAASAISSAGLVAGNAETGTGVQHAFLWSEAMGMVDLNDRLAGTAPGVLTSVLALADDGSVLALAGGTLVLLRPTSGP
jgi:probable HAF family extracellular repeat protein